MIDFSTVAGLPKNNQVCRHPGFRGGLIFHADDASSRHYLMETSNSGDDHNYGRRSDALIKQVHRLYNLGAVGTVPDAQLLEWFVSRQADTAEEAFKELVIRHGPMVLDVCRRELNDLHDAEDAFQATFLVLAHRARSIRRRGSVASWLFGVAHCVATRAGACAVATFAGPENRGADTRGLYTVGTGSRLANSVRGS